MKTTINWRPYPEQKPPSNSEPYQLLLEGRNVCEGFYTGAYWLQEYTSDRVEGVTHFALPEDIITEEA